MKFFVLFTALLQIREDLLSIGSAITTVCKYNIMSAEGCYRSKADLYRIKHYDASCCIIIRRAIYQRRSILFYNDDNIKRGWLTCVVQVHNIVGHSEINNNNNNYNEEDFKRKKETRNDQFGLYINVRLVY